MYINTQWKTLITLAVALSSTLESAQAAYKVGVGRADCTGPSAEVTFMGYAKVNQRGCGLHLRQYARAYIFDDGQTRAAFVTVDACMMNIGIKKEVLEKLEKLYPSVYKTENFVLSGTHTHSAPGGFNMHVLYDVSILGFVPETFEALVGGIVRAVQRAHDNMEEARIFVNNGIVEDANLNRSPASYLFNPQEERDRYNSDTDKDIVQVRFQRVKDDITFGAINWFAVHPTSMNNTNCLLTSDNVGYASILLETTVDNSSLPGQTDFVGAFASANLGDVTPNINGPHCLNTGEPCDSVTSTCAGDAKLCVAFGPGKDMFESTEIIAKRIYQKGLDLLNDVNRTATEVTGNIKFIHQFVSMPNQTAEIQFENGTKQTVKGCLPAMGYAFAAGTIDGVGEFDFHQGTNTSNPFWNIVRDFIFPPTPEDTACQAPKPILIMSGGIDLPYQWQPEVVATQMIKLGNVVLAAVPGEFTTMSGRRLRQTVRDAIVQNGGDANTTRVILTGLSNTYTSYIATPEEYQLQRYEGASTIFGPHTLTIYLKVYKELAKAIMTNATVQDDAKPFEFPDKNSLLSLVTPVLFDTSGWFFNFGDCIQQPPVTAKIGDEISVKFVAGHPRNNLRTEGTFLTVEKQADSGWKVIATDSNWETKFIWNRTDSLGGRSEVEIVWQIGDNVEAGTYRIRHFGAYKYFMGGIYEYQGSTKVFEVTGN